MRVECGVEIMIGFGSAIVAGCGEGSCPHGHGQDANHVSRAL
jgi:hypothetical protein